MRLMTPNPRAEDVMVDEEGRDAALTALHDRWPRTDANYQIKIVDLILSAYEENRRTSCQ